jgi:acetyltransferase
MSVRNLDSLFHPRSVAVIGATDRPNSVGGTVTRNLLQGGFAGPIYPVNPNRAEVQGRRCFARIADLPQTPDLAVICTPPQPVPGIIAELGARGTRVAVVVTAGFGACDPATGKTLRQLALEAARPHLLRIVGPNGVGVQLPPVGLNASFAHVLADPGGIALVTQSGAMATTVIDWAKRHRIGLSAMISLGDMSDVDFGDILDYLASSATTRAILLYVEGITHARKFMSAARAAARGKPIIAIKAGRSAEGARAAASHTGAMASGDAVYDAAFRRAGIVRVDDIDELFGAAETVARVRQLTGDRLAIVTNGGGIGVLATDALVAAGGRLAALSEQTMQRLDAFLPPTWSRGNPVDLVGDAGIERYEKALRVVSEDPAVDAILVLNCPVALSSEVDVARTLAAVSNDTGRPYLACWLGGTEIVTARRILDEAGIPNFETPGAAIQGFMHLIQHKRGQETILEVPPVTAVAPAPEKEVAHALIRQVLAEGRQMLNESEAKDLLRAYGVPVNETLIARTPEAAEKAAASIGGARFVIKILSPDITHKSDVGGVVLDLDSPEAVKAETAAMLERVRLKQPQARLTGVTVQAMIRRPHAWELIVGVSVDPLFGPVILFGQGGTAVEVIGDRALALPPLNRPLARTLIDCTRVSRLLHGFRDRHPADLDALADILVTISDMVAELPEIVELDLNPVLADENGVIVVDARVRVARAATTGGDRLAIRPYPRQLEGRLTLRDGTSLPVRPIRPGDEEALRALVDRLSPEDVRFRFFSAMKRLPQPLAARLTQIDYDREMAFVAIAPGGIAAGIGAGDVLGVSRLAADPDNERAEFAVTIRSDFKGRGLGWALMQQLVAYAKERGTALLHGAVLKDNDLMIKLCRDLGFTLRDDADDPTVYQAELRLRRSAP